MSVPPVRRYRFPTGCIDLAAKPWWIDLLVIGLVFAWMGWTFTTIQQLGFNYGIIAGAVVMASVGILAIYGQRVDYVRFGRFEFNAKGGRGYREADDDGTQEERQKWR